MVSEGVRPFDWVMLAVEVLVVLLILYEIVISEVRSRRESKHHSFLSARVLELSKLRSKGQRIQATVLDPMINNPQIIKPWIDAARTWSEETDAALRNHSERASSAFLLVTDGGHIDRVVSAHGRHFMVTGEIGEAYKQLLLQLENLDRIINNPAAYF